MSFCSAQIVEMIETNRVVVIKGATGSGKTTRVPQFLLNHYIRNGFGSNCNIVVTQPRRISAMSLAARIASERSENVRKVFEECRSRGGDSYLIVPFHFSWASALAIM